MEVLLNANADINAHNSQLCTPLHKARSLFFVSYRCVFVLLCGAARKLALPLLLCVCVLMYSYLPRVTVGCDRSAYGCD